MKEKLSIKERAKKIIGNKNISILRDEKEIMQILLKIEENDDVSNEYNHKILDCIEEYLIMKEKMNTAKEDLKFLNKLANELRKQEIRKTDIHKVPLFKIKDCMGDEIYFLTRQALEEYKKCNQKDSKDSDMVQYNNLELTKLLEIIKRNY